MRALLDAKDQYKPAKYWRLYRQLRRLFYRSTEWQRLRARIHRETPYCFFGKTHPGNRHAHHKKFLADHPELGLDPKNIIPVCERCHRRIHRKSK